MVTKASQKRQLILQAAIQIILEQDFNALTLDAVAKQAGISKGGLLYHFPNKESLIKGLAQFVFEELSVNFHQFAEKDSQKSGKWTRALIEASKIDLEQNAELNVGIFAASYLDSDLANDISKGYQSILAKLENDGIDPVTSTIIRLALDGLYYSKMLNISPLEKERQDEVLQQLLTMTEKKE
jgi:AcrR family transcriptional regulator